jgi:hypothetical protein
LLDAGAAGAAPLCERGGARPSVRKVLVDAHALGSFIVSEELARGDDEALLLLGCCRWWCCAVDVWGG